MEAVCARGNAVCGAHALAAALHSLHLYCASVSAALICCCAPKRPHWYENSWRAQNTRGVANIALGVSWCLGAAAASLRPSETVRLVAALMPPLAWLAAAALHVSFWTRRSTAPILYLAIYWLLSAAVSAYILYHQVRSGASYADIEPYIHAITTVLAMCVCAVDSICFYEEVTKRLHNRQKSAPEANSITYQHNKTHFFSKISFFWLNTLLYRGCESTLEQNDLGELPEEEKSNQSYQHLKKIYNSQKVTELHGKGSMWQCFVRIVWPNFYIAGIMKLFGDLIGVIPPLGLAVIIQFIEDPKTFDDSTTAVTIEEFYKNGHVMLVVVTLALVIQAFLSQNSTHLVTVEGTRLKTALQSMVYDKCMRLASWTSPEPDIGEESPLLHTSEDTNSTQFGLLTNLISQDTYNIMSCVWICHYVWAIPLKVTVILYLLYTKLGVSAIIGTITSIFIITPLQFYIGKKLSDNSKHISKCTDHRVSKISEILQGINVIKLYVWEDIFNEKILQLREVELKLLNKDSVYWGFLTFTTQVSTVLVTVITFTLYYFLEDSKGLTAVNVFAGLALFNQLTIPLLILPVTVLMIIQAMVSTKRIKNFLDLPESSNVQEENIDENSSQKTTKKIPPSHIQSLSSTDECNGPEKNDSMDLDSEEIQISDDDGSEPELEYLVRFRNAAFSWKMKDNTWLDIGDLDISTGKLIMVIGSTGSGKSSLLSAVLGEMNLERGDVHIDGNCSMWYAGQPPWLLECSIRENVVMDSPWCPKRYARVIRAAGLRPDLQLLPDGDNTFLGSHGTPLSGGQRVRVCVARALYSRARLLALDEPLGALDGPLARHVVARGLLPAARARRAVLLATNRLELLHYADLVIVMEDGRVSGFGKTSGPGAGKGAGSLGEWARLAAEARAAAARCGAGPPGGAARERLQLVRALSRIRLQRGNSDDPMVGISEAAGAHLLAEVPTCAGGSWRRAPRVRCALARQLSSPPPAGHNSKWQREVRRTVSVDASNVALRRLLRPRTHRTLARWTPKTLRRLISSDSDTPPEETQINNGAADDPTLDSTFTSLTSNGVESTTVSIPEKPTECKEEEPVLNESTVWWKYARACGWWGAAYCAAAAGAQALALAADASLARAAADNSRAALDDQQMWDRVRIYALWSLSGAAAAGGAQAACAAAGARARRALHGRLLAAALHAPLHVHHAKLPGALLHRFSADVLVVDKKLATAVSRWAQLALMCGAALAVNAAVAPWSLLAIVPALAAYLALQNVYLRNARELQRAEASSAASVVALASGARAGAGAVRAARLQPRMRAALFRRLDANHAALLLLNAANRWLGLALDLVGAACVCVSLALSLRSASGGGGAEGGAGREGSAGLAGAYALLLPAYLAHLAKCRADLHWQLAAVERLLDDTRLPQEDYRDDCPIPADWERKGKMEFQDVSTQHQPGTAPVLKNINLTVQPGEKVAICGRSGSGKSTLLMSCAGAATVLNGRILLDGHDVARVPLRALRHRVVVLPQEPVMFSGTLRENLDPLAVHTDDEIWQSLRAVGLEDFVHAQPAGLECSVGRGGGGWSAGRAARACGARAALRARLAAALLLDEPGAALDAPAERALLAALPALAPATTVLTVAHRISSLEGYDAAVVLEEGRVAERGPLRALLQAPASRLARLLPAAQDLAAVAHI